MSYEIDYNGAAFTVNEQGDPPPWGFDQTPLVQAIIDGALVQNGDNFSLSTVDGDFGALYGVKAIYYKSRSSNISSTGILRLNNNSDVISFRNAANSGNLDIKANASNLLIFNGDTVYTIGAGTLTNSDISASAAIDFSKLATLSSGNIILGSAGNVPTSTAMSGDVVITSSGVTAISTGVIVNADVNASAAIDRTKLASGTASHVVINDGGGVMSSEAQVAVTRGGTGQSSYTNGQLLIGNTTGNTLAKATLTGTANQVVVTNSTGSITLSTPQDIGTSSAVVFGSVGVGAALDSASILSLSSTTKGFLPPRLTSTEMNAIASPTTGLTIYNSTSNAIFVYDGASWVQLAAGGSGTVNSGLANTLAYYPSTGTAVDDLTAITASRALVSNASGLPIASVTTTTELSYVSGVTSALQTQIDTKAPTASPTFTGNVLIGNGTEAAPGLAFAGDPDSGLTWIAANRFGLGVNGAVSMQLRTTHLEFSLPTAMKGWADNSSAAAGDVGEYKEIIQSQLLNATTTTEYLDVATLSLTAGDWDVTGITLFFDNGATITRRLMAISLYSGNTTTDHVLGSTVTEAPAPSSPAASDSAATIANLRISLSGTTTVYLKQAVTYSAGTAQLQNGKLTARRAR